MRRFSHISMDVFSNWNEKDESDYDVIECDYWNFSIMLEVCPFFGNTNNGHNTNQYLFE